MSASLTTPSIDARTKSDWSASGVIARFGGSESFVCASVSRTLRDDVERRRRAGLQDRQQRRALAVDAHDVGLRRIAVADLRHVADEDDRAARRADRQIVQALDRRRAAVGLDRVLVGADLGGAGRQDQVLRR